MGGVTGRRPVAAVAALVLALEAVGFVLVNIFLGMVVDKQEMSLAGLEPRATTVSAVIAGAVLGAYLLSCGGVLLRAAIRDTAPAGFFRILLISCAVLHGVLGAFSVGLVGWLAFAFMMVVLALLVWSLVAYGDGARTSQAQDPSKDGPAQSNGGAGNGGASGGGSTGAGGSAPDGLPA